MDSPNRVRVVKDLYEAGLMMLRLLEDNDLDEHFDGETECLRDALTKYDGINRDLAD